MNIAFFFASSLFNRFGPVCRADFNNLLPARKVNRFNPARFTSNHTQSIYEQW